MKDDSAHDAKPVFSATMQKALDDLQSVVEIQAVSEAEFERLAEEGKVWMDLKETAKSLQ